MTVNPFNGEQWHTVLELAPSFRVFRNAEHDPPTCPEERPLATFQVLGRRVLQRQLVNSVLT